MFLWQCHIGPFQPGKSPVTGVVFDRQRDKRKKCRERKQAYSDQEQCRKCFDHYNTSQQYPLYYVAAKLNKRHQLASQHEPAISGRVLHRMSALMRSNRRGSYTVTVIDLRAEVDRFREWIIMIG